MNEIIKYTITYIMIFFIFYILISFVNMNINASEWNKDYRVFCVIFSIITTVCFIAAEEYE